MASTSHASAMRSRSRDRVFLVGYPAHQITGCKLPSNRQVLATLFYHVRVVKLKNVSDAATMTVREALLFWEKARIPTKHEKDAKTKLEKLHAKWRDVQKRKNRPTESAKNKIKEFANMLDDLFDLAHQDALTLMSSEEDKAFLLKQREKGRRGSMVGVDLKLAKMEEKKQQKELAEMNKRFQADIFDMGKFFLTFHFT
uniref:Uncharacterized protein n=1 Tax=Cacopsylla melanoneura TaxID=428564 RepID=A0A8D8VV66_9HEMI